MVPDFLEPWDGGRWVVGEREDRGRLGWRGGGWVVHVGELKLSVLPPSAATDSFREEARPRFEKELLKLLEFGGQRA